MRGSIRRWRKDRSGTRYWTREEWATNRNRWSWAWMGVAILALVLNVGAAAVVGAVIMSKLYQMEARS